MKTLYVSDLDGTLLNSDRKLSEYTIETLNKLTEKGMLFSYATARSFLSASVVTRGLMVKVPIITLNGTFIADAKSGEKLISHYFTEEQKSIFEKSFDKFQVFPLVYSLIDDNEKVSWLEDKENDEIKNYLKIRKGDKRLRPVSLKDDLYEGEIFTFIYLGKKDEIKEVYDYFFNTKDFTCYFQKELYVEDYWCEVMPKNTSKGSAINKLKNMLGAERVITFGDAINDIPMFEISDESYAVENAVEELKNHATGVIKSNDDNGVAEWLINNFSP